MDFALSPRATDLQQRLLAFMEEAVIPAEPVFAEEMRASGDPHFHPKEGDSHLHPKEGDPHWHVLLGNSRGEVKDLLF